MKNPTIRASDWEDRLSNYLELCRERSFAWGSFDCAMFAGGAVLAMTGVDPVESIRETYSDEEGARLRLRDLGEAQGHTGTLFGFLNHRFGPSKPASLAKRGDIVASDKTTLGICVGQWAWFVARDGSGLIAAPMSECVRAWTVRFAS